VLCEKENFSWALTVVCMKSDKHIICILLFHAHNTSCLVGTLAKTF
jgi:hypothetical protein